MSKLIIEPDNLLKLALAISVITVITIDLGVSTGNAIWPFDQFMTPTTNETENLSSQDPSTNESLGEDGELPEGEN